MTTKKNRKATPLQVEQVWEALGTAQKFIKLAFTKDSSPERDCSPDVITDKQIREFYYRINDMCIELNNRGVMWFQKESEDGE